MFNLASFDHLRTDPRVAFKRETVGGKDVVIVAYMIADKEFWDQEMALETRGAVFDAETGFCLSRPFEKFFNVGERDETQMHRLNFENARVFEKRDGSMITPALINGKIYLKSKKSFFSDVAKAAQEVASPYILELCRACCTNFLTPIFEFTHPDHKIVIDYGVKPKFVLLAIRRNDTGDYLDVETVRCLASSYGIEYIREFDLTAEEIVDQMKTLQNFEGYVITLADGRRVKMKTDWYLRNHRVMTGLRIRDVAEAVADETIDDLKSALSLDGKDLTPIEEIEHRVVTEIDQIRVETEALLNSIRLLPTRKEAALKYGKHENFGLAMKLYDGKEVDYAKVWKARRLKEMPLRCVYNEKFGGDG
jgi:RNA ligase